MSTFDGKVKEFPDIRIDYFRKDPNARPPLAFFLSHVHSDHLVGLESCKSPFVYCSPGTRDILLRLEKYPHRMNFARGILESRKQHYCHLKNLLKAIPLETPTVIELAPGNDVRVTLFDANHCVGAVMFLIEGGGKAVLYTGDIRSEQWWVEALKRHPVLAPYASPQLGSPLKKLDCLYLDTTFVVSGREDPYCHFAPKAEGLAELLQKVSRYPKDTIFYVDAWTFGYEDVWQALSNFLGCQIHVDKYRYKLYRSLADGIEHKAPEAVKMVGFMLGNHQQHGCLTTHWSRLHSCERGTDCDIWDKDHVRITPIVTRHNGRELAELGTGGGQGDLNKQHELDVTDHGIVGQLIMLCVKKLDGQTQLLSQVLNLLTDAMANKLPSIHLEEFKTLLDPELLRSDDFDLDTEELSFDQLIAALSKLATAAASDASIVGQGKVVAAAGSTRRVDGLPSQITFPYSRHSSYEELCMLVQAFAPRDIHPCTVDERNWKEESSMHSLFDHIYTNPPAFNHDQQMHAKWTVEALPMNVSSRPSSAGQDYGPQMTPPRQNEEDDYVMVPRPNADEPVLRSTHQGKRGGAGTAVPGAQIHVVESHQHPAAAKSSNQPNHESARTRPATDVPHKSIKGDGGRGMTVYGPSGRESKDASPPRHQDREVSREAQNDIQPPVRNDRCAPIASNPYARSRNFEMKRSSASTLAYLTDQPRERDHTDREHKTTGGVADAVVDPRVLDFGRRALQSSRPVLGTPQSILRPQTQPPGRTKRSSPSSPGSSSELGRGADPPSRSQWPKHVREAPIPEPDSELARSMKRSKPSPGPGEDGRLTPPGSTQVRTGMLPSSHPGRKHSSPSSQTMAFRQQVFDAIEGKSELNWFDLELVSIGGHQEKELEL